MSRSPYALVEPVMTPSSPTQERRQLKRHCATSVRPGMTVSMGDKAIVAPVRDIACTGLAVLLDHRIDPGTLVTVELLNRTWNFWHLKLVRVIHATLQPDGQWLIGSTFLRKFADEEFTALLGMSR